MKTEQEFRAWMKKVDEKIADKLGGLNSNDLPDIAYCDLFEEGMTPSQAAAEAIRGMME